MDPVLCVYKDCRLMLPFNNDVKSGQANGTQTLLQKVVLKQGETASQIMLNGQIPVKAVHASQVDHMVLRHCNDRITPELFSVSPKRYTSFKARIPKPESLQLNNNDREWITMRGVQVPVLVNNATTGHKLQGSGVDNLFVHNWSDVTNWSYVMLSRVRTHTGLFCRKNLSENLSKYKVPEGLTNMLRSFEQRRPRPLTEDSYEELLS